MKIPTEAYPLVAFLVFLASSGSLNAQVTSTSQQNGTWPCVCEAGGSVGTQVYTGDENQDFTECRCTSGCALCPVGQILDHSIERNNSCVCLSSLYVIIRLSQLSLSNYTLSMENKFLNYIASFLQLSPSQVIPGARRSGSVILDLYIISTDQSQESRDRITNMLLKKNSTENDTLKNSVVGPWTLLYLGRVSEKSGQGVAAQGKVDGKLLVLILLLCATITVAFLLASLTVLLYKRKRQRHMMFWFEEDSNSSGFRTLINHQNTLNERYQVYDNTCFNGSTGCIGRRSFKINTRFGPLLGTVARQFSYSELQEASQNFCKTNIIGTGGSSCVYKGCLKDGRDVAIKKLTTDGVGFDREFLLEVELLSRLHHFHLVPLLGYCIETRGLTIERLLVYEFMPNGNVREHLNQTFGKETLNWSARLRIALGAARGLEYLHEAAEPRVVHRDFKSSNILLDSKWRAKVADFGMATTIKEVDCNACPTSPAQMLGTFGYFAPEYAMMGRATTKSDVFSFGVVLLELLSGRKPVDKNLTPKEESLVVWALPLLRNTARLVNELVDPVLHHQGLLVEDVQTMAHLAWLCLQMDPESRPTMTFVVQVLATLIPENSVRLSEFGPLLELRDQAPKLLSWAHDYSFSRDDKSSPCVPVPVDVGDPCKTSSRRWCDRQTFNLDIDQEMVHKKGELTRHSFTSTSLSAAEYLEKFTAMIAFDAKKRTAEDEADLVKPRLEYFWQNNGLVAQIPSPSR